MSVYVYVEGGGSGALRRACRAGFTIFLRNAGLAGRMPRVVACGSREDALDYFRTELNKGVNIVLLLVDAEGSVNAPVTDPEPWQHLKDRDGWDRPDQASKDHCHLMVQVMESWFLTDAATLKSYFRQGFQENSLPKNPNVEQIPKQEVERSLRQATRRTSKGEYSKGKHSFEILAELDAAKVREKSPYAERFFTSLEKFCQS